MWANPEPSIACGLELIIKLIHLINTRDYFYLEFLIKVLNKKTSSTFLSLVKKFGDIFKEAT